MTQQGQYQKERAAAYDGVIGIIQRRIDSLAPQIAVEPGAISPGAALAAARRDAWTQFLKGVKQLKDGGVGGAPGSFAAAVSLASLRSTALGATLGVRPPRFEDNYFEMPYKDGAAEARYFCYALIGAVLHDMPASRKAIQHKIAAAAPVTMPDDAPDIEDPELARIFGAALKSSAKEAEADMLLIALRRQTVLTLNMLFDAYQETGTALKAEMKQVFSPSPPPGPPLKSHSFDF
jgi:hypothetical protein